MSNAVKFSQKGGNVFVRIRKSDTSVGLSVIDQGQGIAADFVPHIFERFRQQDASVTRNYGGLGLGLAIVRHLIELHGGTVRAESPGLNQGATFVIRLPVTSFQNPQQPSPIVPEAAPDVSISNDYSCEKLDGIRVLVVDDDDDTRALVTRLWNSCRNVQ